MLGITPPLNYMTMDVFTISSAVHAQESPQGQTIPAPPGTVYTLTRQALQNVLVGLFYNGVLELPGFHYKMVGRIITLNFNALDGDNLCALYVATTLN